MILLFQDVLIEIGSNNAGDWVVGEGQSAISRGLHQVETRLHHPVQLNQKDRQQMCQLRVGPKLLAGSVKPAFSKVDFCPEKIAV